METEEARRMETEATPELYRAPEVLPEGFTSMFVRDELLRCFESANREFLKILNQPVVDDQLRGQVHQFVTQVFRACGVSFENPTKAGILAAIDACKTGAEQMMGDKGADIIRHHYDEMMNLVARLPDV